MDDSKKKEILTKILDLVQEIYPYMDRITLTDLDEPRSIIITNDEAIREIAEEFGVDPELLDDVREDIEIGGENDDDEGGGYLQ